MFENIARMIKVYFVTVLDIFLVAGRMLRRREQTRRKHYKQRVK